MSAAPEPHLVTFGQRFHYDEHPVLGMRPQLPDGYGVVYARTAWGARDLAFECLGTAWSMIYPPGGLNTDLFPLGRLFTITTPGGRPVIQWTYQEGTTP